MNTQKISMLASMLAVASLVACQEDATEVNQEAFQQTTGCELAYPDETGNLITIPQANGEDMVIEEVNGEYVWMGDILLSEEQVAQLKEGTDGARTGMSSIANLWPTATVYYTINSNLPNQSRVTSAIAHWEAQMPSLRFVQRTTQSNYVEFVKGSGCSSALGMRGGRQVINLADACSTGNTIHEIGHALGLFHEQSRTDRNNSIIVNFNNIESGKEHNFRTYTEQGYQGFQIGAFDFNSIMLYGSYAFSDNGQPTITRLDGSTFSGQRSTLSAGDLEIANRMYGPPFARLEYDLVREIDESYANGTYEVRYEEYDVYIAFYQDRNRTVPMNTPRATTISYSVQQYDSNSNYGGTVTSNYTKSLSAGVQRVFLRNLVTNDCREEYGNPVGSCYSRWATLKKGLNYNN